MRAIKFKDANINFAESQDEYTTLPALRIGDKCDTIVTCWKLSFWERIKILFTGVFWMSEMNFGKPLTPRFFSVNRKNVYYRENEKPN